MGAGIARGVALEDRGVIAVAGAEAEGFLHNLLTNDMTGLEAGQARYAALLTPQGKILADMLVTPEPDALGGGFLIDCPRALVPDLVKRLSMYRLRAKAAIEDKSASLGVIALWDGAAPAGIVGDRYGDPRHPRMGERMIVIASEIPRILEALRPATRADYDAHRIALGVPQGGQDFAYGDTFVHEANLDRLNGVNFRKGCYVGQEVVSRVEHRGSARKRVVRVAWDGPRAPEQGAQVMAGEIVLGAMGSAVAGQGLAMLRLDKLEDARAAGAAIIADGILLACNSQ